MKKITKRITGLTLGLALVAGAGIAVATAYTVPVETKAADENGTASFTLTDVSDKTVDGIKVSFAKGKGTNAPFFTTDKYVRLYANNTVTISSKTNDITNITFNWVENPSKKFAALTADVGSYSHPTTSGEGKWTSGEDPVRTIVFTLGISGQLQLNTFTVTYDGVAPTTFTVTYDGNENTGGSVPVDETEYDSGATVTVLGNTGSLEKTGYTFSGWNTKKDGTGTSYDAGATFNITEATTLFAKWTANDATISFDLNGGEGDIPDPIDSKYDDKITLPSSSGITREGFAFVGWNENAGGTGKTYDAGSQYTVKGTTTLYAKWSELGAKYRLIKDASSLSVGDVISFASVKTEENAAYSVAMAGQNTNNRAKTDIVVSDEEFVSNTEVAEVTLEKSGDDWLLKTKEGYLCASGGTKDNKMTSVETSESLTTHWSITIDESYNATIVCKEDTSKTSKNNVRYNASSSIFSCYASGQADIQLYLKETAASKWASTFYNSLKGEEGVCDPTGQTDPAKLKEVWDKQAEEYEKLDAASKKTIVDTEASETGTIIQKAVQIYDFCISKYDSTVCNPFITGRTPHDGGKVVNNNNVGMYIAIIAVTSLVAVSAIGGYFFVKKSKKEK